MVSQNPESAWANLAHAHALQSSWRNKESLPYFKKALKGLNNNPLAVASFTIALSESRELQKAEALLNEKKAIFDDRAMFAILQAIVLLKRSSNESGRESQELLRRSLELFRFAKIQKHRNALPFFLAGKHLVEEKQFRVAFEFLKIAKQLAPKSISVYNEFWRGFIKSKSGNLTKNLKTFLENDIRRFLQRTPPSARVYDLVSVNYALLDQNTKAIEYQNLLKQEFPVSIESSWLKWIEIRSYSNSPRTAPELDRQTVIALAGDYLQRRWEYRPTLEPIYKALLNARKEDKSFSNKEFIFLIDRAIEQLKGDPSELFVAIVDGLTSRNLIVEAEKYALLGVEKTKAWLESIGDTYTDQKLYDTDYRTTISSAECVLGKALFKGKKYDDAEILLTKNQCFPMLFEMYSEQGNVGKAENALVSMLASTDETEEILIRIKSFYEARNGSERGYEDYLRKIKEMKFRKRREIILSEKTDSLGDMPAFVLNSLEGRPLDSEELEGKIVVINFWATWCAPCIEEMPQFQELYRKYQNDKDVVIVSIAEDSLKSIVGYMNKERMDFPVLINQSPPTGIPVGAYPTTWFIDRSGKISFYVVGRTKNLTEEFSLRIESLR